MSIGHSMRNGNSIGSLNVPKQHLIASLYCVDSCLAPRSRKRTKNLADAWPTNKGSSTVVPVLYLMLFNDVGGTQLLVVVFTLKNPKTNEQNDRVMITASLPGMCFVHRSFAAAFWFRPLYFLYVGCIWDNVQTTRKNVKRVPIINIDRLPIPVCSLDSLGLALDTRFALIWSYRTVFPVMCQE